MFAYTKHIQINLIGNSLQRDRSEDFLDKPSLNRLRIREGHDKTNATAERLEKWGAMPNLEKPQSESQTVCEQCQLSPALFSYELFSAKRLIKGSCCAGCFLDLLRGLRCISVDA